VARIAAVLIEINVDSPGKKIKKKGQLPHRGTAAYADK
jgi:hypothetical protein